MRLRELNAHRWSHLIDQFEELLSGVAVALRVDKQPIAERDGRDETLVAQLPRPISVASVRVLREQEQRRA